MHAIDLRKRIYILIVLLSLIGLTSWYFINKRNNTASASALQASGTVEAAAINIAPELSGKVVEVFVEKGSQVKADIPLFRLDTEMLEAQRKRATAALASAQANLSTAESGLASAEAAYESAQANLESVQSSAKAERLPVQKTLDELEINAAAARGEAARRVAEANRAFRNADYLYDMYTVSSLQKDLTPDEGLMLTKKMLDEAREAFEPYRNASENDPQREKLKEELDNAQSEYDSAVRRIELVAALEAAEALLYKAEDDLAKLQDGPNPQDVAILEARLEAIDAAPKQAEIAVEAAQVGVDSAHTRLEAAQAFVSQTQAELELINLQIKKMTVYAPIDGVVLNRIIEPGEVVQPGATVMTIGQLSPLKITVYIPEDRYGEITLGQTAQVSVDSFPGQEFPASVVHIADQAEFTPRNVQTVEGRRDTVFAIELSIENPEYKLKPGMPADVNFE
jgi:HlyD family secretion protein